MPVTLVPVPGVPEVREGDDLAALLVRAARAAGTEPADGDIFVVSSKVVSKSLGLWADPTDRAGVVAQQSRRVVAERRAGDRVTQVVESVAGPVMAAAGVDASNTGGREALLLLPADPDGEAQRLRSALLAATGLHTLGVVVSDTSGRPWRVGQTDFALGAAGLAVLDDLRGGVDADGRDLHVTTRAVADELAAAADLVKGKVDAIPAAIVRGTDWAGQDRGQGAAALLRVGAGDWFGLGAAEAVRAALGTEPGSARALRHGIASVGAEDLATRCGRAVAVALHGLPGVGIDTGGSVLQVSADTPYRLGLALARLEVALWGEGLTTQLPDEAGSGPVTLTVRER